MFYFNEKLMRNLRQLLGVVLFHPEHFSYGICGWVERLYTYNVITYDERVELRCFLMRELPKKKYPNDLGDPYLFSWPIRELEPRVQWINDQLKKPNLD